MCNRFQSTLYITTNRICTYNKSLHQNENSMPHRRYINKPSWYRGVVFAAQELGSYPVFNAQFSVLYKIESKVACQISPRKIIV